MGCIAAFRMIESSLCGPIHIGRRRTPLKRTAHRGPLAQLAEQQTLNLRVEGSIPSRLTIIAVQHHQQLATCYCRDGQQESNRVRVAPERQSVDARFRADSRMHDPASSASSHAAAS